MDSNTSYKWREKLITGLPNCFSRAYIRKIAKVKMNLYFKALFYPLKRVACLRVHLLDTVKLLTVSLWATNISLCQVPIFQKYRFFSSLLQSNTGTKNTDFIPVFYNWSPALLERLFATKNHSHWLTFNVQFKNF